MLPTVGPAPSPAPGVGLAQFSSASNLWSGSAGASGPSTPGGPGIQLPQRTGPGLLAGAGAGAATPGPLKARADSAEAGDGTESKQTDIDALMDAVGISGVDIGAEEEGLRLASERMQTVPSGPVADRSRKQDFIDPSVLADVVKKIAAAFQLRTLEPDTIPLIALATRHRLLSLITSSIAARDHRLNASHLRPPPFSTKRPRSSSRSPSPPRRERSPAWDIAVLDEQEKVLGVLERVDREEERKKRRERMIREQKEQEERDLAEAVAASAAAEAEREASGGAGERLVVGGSGVSTPKGKEGKDGKEKKEKKEKKKKKEGAMSEDVRKRLTDQVAMRSIGGKSFSWATAGASMSGFASPTPSNLPKPKFAPGSSLPPPTFGTPIHKPSGLGAPSFTPGSGEGLLSRVTGVPPLHDAGRRERDKEEWERGVNVVERGDLVFALERERGMGVGRGSGRDSIARARAGVPTRGRGR